MKLLLAASNSSGSKNTQDESLEKDRAISNDTVGLSTVSIFFDIGYFSKKREQLFDLTYLI
jgi:hypothetical protein